MILYMYIAQGKGRQTFDANQKPLSLCPFVAALKKIALKSNFIYMYTFSSFTIMYIAPGQGQTTLCGQNPDVNRKASSLCPFVASFKKNIFGLILWITFHVLYMYMYIAKGQGQTTPWDRFLF